MLFLYNDTNSPELPFWPHCRRGKVEPEAAEAERRGAERVLGGRS